MRRDKPNLLRKIRHTLGQHEWRHFDSIEGPLERFCVIEGCDRVEEYKDGQWIEKEVNE